MTSLALVQQHIYTLALKGLSFGASVLQEHKDKKKIKRENLHVVCFP